MDTPKDEVKILFNDQSTDQACGPLVCFDIANNPEENFDDFQETVNECLKDLKLWTTSRMTIKSNDNQAIVITDKNLKSIKSAIACLETILTFDSDQRKEGLFLLCQTNNSNKYIK